MPNRNSYFALSIPYSRDALGDVAMACQAAAADAGHRFDAMVYEDLHITFFFMAEVLRALSASQLREFHAAIASAVRHADLSAQQLIFTGLELFPPGKSNLIVATFDAPQPLRDLQAQVCRLAREQGIAGSDSERRRLFGDDSWTPHCTLGKLKAKSSEVGKLGYEVISAVQTDRLGDGVATTGVILCGEVPKQAWIDWEGSLGFHSEEDAAAEDQTTQSVGELEGCVGSTRRLQAAVEQCNPAACGQDPLRLAQGNNHH